MEPGLTWLLVGLAATLAAVVGATVTALVVARRRRRVEEQLGEARHELETVQRRLDQISRRLERREAADQQEYVITSAGRPDVPAETAAGSHAAAPASMTARQFTSVALGESLVTLASLAYGVRRALSPENRNRIRFEMRREVRRARKERRRDLKDAKRYLRTKDAA